MSDIPIPSPAKKNLVPEPPTPTVGGFFAEHRALVDARKAHLGRVGIGVPQNAEKTELRSVWMGPAPAAPAIEGPHELPTQAKVLAMPATTDEPLVPLPREAAPEKVPATYEARRLPKLPGVNVDLAE